MRTHLLAAAMTLAALTGTASDAGAAAQAGVKAGYLSCQVSSGYGFVFGSSRDVNCVYAPVNGGQERYSGEIKRWGVDVGYLSAATLVWAVVSPTANLEAKGLQGTYGGVTAEASVGLGVGANVLLGGSNNQVALQPVSIEGTQGLNIAAGVAGLTLKAVD